MPPDGYPAFQYLQSVRVRKFRSPKGSFGDETLPILPTPPILDPFALVDRGAETNKQAG